MINTTFINTPLARADKCHNVDPNDDEIGGVVYISGYEADIMIQNSTFKSNQTTDQSHFIVLYQTESPRIANSLFSRKKGKRSSFINHIGLEQSVPLTMKFWNNTFIFRNTTLTKGKAKHKALIASSQIATVELMETHYASSKIFYISFVSVFLLFSSLQCDKSPFRCRKHFYSLSNQQLYGKLLLYLIHVGFIFPI